MRKYLSITIIFLTLVFSGFAQEIPEMSDIQEELYKAGFGVPRSELAAPDITVSDLEGTSFKLSDLKGKVVLLNLWATWCPPCRAEMPSIENLHNQLSTEDFAIMAVSTPTPPRETKEKVVEFIAENGYTFPVYIDDTQQAAYQYGSGSIPTSWIIDAEGKIVARFVGATEWNSEMMIRIFRSLMP